MVGTFYKHGCKYLEAVSIDMVGDNSPLVEFERIIVRYYLTS